MGYNIIDSVKLEKKDTTAIVEDLAYRRAYTEYRNVTNSEGFTERKRRRIPAKYLAEVYFPELGTRKVISLTKKEFEEIQSKPDNTIYQARYSIGRFSGNYVSENLTRPLSTEIKQNINFSSTLSNRRNKLGENQISYANKPDW